MMQDTMVKMKRYVSHQHIKIQIQDIFRKKVFDTKVCLVSHSQIQPKSVPFLFCSHSSTSSTPAAPPPPPGPRGGVEGVC